MKPAKYGSLVEWHQDFAFLPHTNDDIVSTLVYLDDATKDNGCLQVLPGHHHSYFNHNTEDGFFAGCITEDILTGEYGEPIPLEAPAGSVIFMHCMLPHCSLPNSSNHDRRTMILEYRAADSYPIYYGEQAVRFEQGSCQLRGEPSPYARFGSIAPFIPLLPEQKDSKYISIYHVQNQI